MKSIDKYSWIDKLRQGVGSVVLGASLLLSATVVDAGTLKLNLQGCKSGDNGYHSTLINDPHSGHTDYLMYLCDDSAYVEGNLKHWAEFDMVPHRFIVTNDTGSAQTFTFQVGGDYKDTKDPNLRGWDFITELALNEDLSDPICKDIESVVTQDLIITSDEQTIYREVTVTNFPDGAKCVADYNMRLAIGSSGYTGNSLQDFLEGAGKQTLSLSTVIPTTLDKSMTAVESGGRDWTVTKSATPAIVDFENTCSDTAVLEKDVTITVSWTKGEVTPSGKVNVTTVISASNRAKRAMNIDVTDTLYSGTKELNTTNCTAVLTKNTAEQTVCSNTFTIDAKDAVKLNDKAVATYSDPDHPSSPLLGTREAIASADVQGTSGTSSNESAVIKDREWIIQSADKNFKYSVESATGATGSFAAYTLGTPTDGEVIWTSDSQTASGSVTFAKKVYSGEKTISVGQLFDEASLEGSDGFAVNTSPVEIYLNAQASVALTITKTVNQEIVDENKNLDFNFNISRLGVFYKTVTIHIPAGSTSNSITISGMDPSIYNVEEVPPAGYAPVGDKNKLVDLQLPICKATVEFVNKLADRPAVKVRKVAFPAKIGTVDQGVGWTMTLFRKTDSGSWEEVVTKETTGTGAWLTLVDTDHLTAGTYKIEETPKEGWYKIGETSDCAFDYAGGNLADFECTLGNAKYGKIIINKDVTAEDPSSAVFNFTQDIDSAEALELSDGESKTYENLKTVQSGTSDATLYRVSENDPAPDFDLTNLVCKEYYSDGSSAVQNSVTDVQIHRRASIMLDPGETVECTFTNTPVDQSVPCACDDIDSDSSSALGSISAALMIVMTLMLGLFFARREQLNRIER